MLQGVPKIVDLTDMTSGSLHKAAIRFEMCVFYQNCFTTAQKEFIVSAPNPNHAEDHVKPAIIFCGRYNLRLGIFFCMFLLKM